MFETLWSKATLSEQRIREIEDAKVRIKAIEEGFCNSYVRDSVIYLNFTSPPLGFLIDSIPRANDGRV